ncbi:phosphatase PAP2 family protein [Sorangium sp. So ce131]|uniref:phosphatase PAP2 family protein n=1 Tax=Sorangium sp. So ce131 TaxID=3133282 RepID=UPI003F640A7E
MESAADRRAARCERRPPPTRLQARRLASAALAAATLLGAAAAGAEQPAAPRGGAAEAGSARGAGKAGALRPAAAAPTLAAAPTAAGPRRPPPARQVAWDPRWPRFRVGEYVATGVVAATAFATLAIPPVEGRWTGVSGFDRSAREVMRIGSDRNREFARDASDLLLVLTTNHLAVDALLVAWWGHGRGSVAWQLAMIDIETLALNAAVNGVVAGFASRERPYRAQCGGPEELQDRDCRGSKRYRSFYSGHSSTAFTAAGLTCSHHARLPLYGGGAADALACGASLATAAAVATLRVVSDQHFATDALTGAALGTLTGFGVPWLLHYRGGARAVDAGAPRGDGVSIRFVPAPLGGYLVGRF